MTLAVAPALAETLSAERLEIHAFIEAAKAGELETVRERLDAGMPVDVTQPPKP